MSEAPNVAPILTNPLAPPAAADEASQGPYDVALAMGQELRDKPRSAPTRVQVGTQHGKGRMTVWERIDTLKDPGDEPTILFQNWGKNLDGASIVTGVTKVNGRDTAFYGHDFTVRAGSMDATNGRKLANVMRLAGERGIPLVGMNDSAGSRASCRASCACSASTPAVAPTCRAKAAS